MARIFHSLALAAVIALSLPSSSRPEDVPAPQDLLSLIPRQGELGHWKPEGEPVICFDEDCLAGFIDGAAPFYLERGVVAVLFQNYLDPHTGAELKLELYRLRGPEAARSLFQEAVLRRTSAGGEDLQHLGEQRILEEALHGVWILHFWQGAHFVRIEGYGGQRGTVPARSAVIELGSWLSRALCASGSKPR